MSKITLLLCLIFQFFICSLSFAENELPSFDCTLSDTVSDDEIGDAKDIFNNDVPKIYLYCDSEDVQKGQKIRSEWIAVDTNNVAPANYKIDEMTFDVTKELKSYQVFTAKFSLSKPNSGWPAGQYVVNVYVDDELEQSVKFSVK